MDPAYPVADLRKPKRNKLVKKAALLRQPQSASDPVLPISICTKDSGKFRDHRQWLPIVPPGPSRALQQTPLSSQRVDLLRTPPRTATDDMSPMFSLLSRKKKSRDGQSAGSFDATFDRGKAGAYRHGVEAEGPLVQGSIRTTPSPVPPPPPRHPGRASSPRPSSSTTLAKPNSGRPHALAVDAVHYAELDSQPCYRAESHVVSREWPLPSHPSTVRDGLDLGRPLPRPPTRPFGDCQMAGPRVLPWNDNQSHQRSQSQSPYRPVTSATANHHVRNFSSSNRQFYELDNSTCDWIASQAMNSSSMRHSPFMLADAAQSAPDINAFMTTQPHELDPPSPLPKLLTELSPATTSSQPYSPSLYEGSPVLQHHLPAIGSQHNDYPPAALPISELPGTEEEILYHEFPLPPSRTSPPRLITPPRASPPQMVHEDEFAGFDFGVDTAQISLDTTSASRLSTISELSRNDFDGLSSYEVSPIDETDISLLELDDLPDYRTSQKEAMNAKRSENERRAQELRTMWLTSGTSTQRLS